MSLLENLLQLNQLGANVDQTRAATKDTLSQADYRNAQQQELVQKLSDAQALRRATMNAQTLADNTNAGLSADGMGPPAPGGASDSTPAPGGASGSSDGTGTNISPPSGLTAQAALIQRNMQTSQTRMRAAQMQSDAAGRIGNFEAKNKADDDVRAWQTQIDTQSTELAKARTDIASGLASAAGSVLPSGANLPQVLAAMDALQPGVSSKIPIARDPATGRPVWNQQTANALQTMQDQGMKAVDQYNVKNQQAERAQAEANAQQTALRDAQTAKHQDEDAAISRGNLKVSQDRLDFEKNKDTSTSERETRLQATQAIGVGNSMERDPTVKWVKTNMPTITQAVNYADGVNKGTAKVTTTDDQALSNAYVKIALDAAPRTAKSWQMLRDNYNVPESLGKAISSTYEGRTLPSSVRNDMINTIKQRGETQRQAALEQWDQKAQELIQMGQDPNIYLPKIPRYATDKPAPSFVSKNEQATVGSLLGGK